LVDIDHEIVNELGQQEAVTFAQNLFSFINENVYYPAGFNLQISEINLRTSQCHPESAHLFKCLQRIRENGQPSNSHLVHHMAYSGAIGVGSVGGLYTKNDWNGVSGCPSIKGRFSMWERICVSHEIGHNFGGIHTHTTQPQVDTCGSVCSSGGQMNVPYGTIMSYCHQCSGGYNNIRFEFHQVTVENYLWNLYETRQNQMNVLNAVNNGESTTKSPATTNSRFTTSSAATTSRSTHNEDDVDIDDVDEVDTDITDDSSSHYISVFISASLFLCLL